MAELLSFADAASLLDDVRRGAHRFDGRSSPLLVVDLDDPPGAGGSALAAPVTSPLVVAGISRSHPVPGISGPDLLITELPDAPRPWVTADAGIARALEGIESAVAANPYAAVSLFQVLRTTEHLDVGGALVVESLAYAALQAGPEHRRWLDRTRRPSPDHDESPAVVLERHQQCLSITLDRPTRRNAYSARMRDGLIEGLVLAGLDDSIETVRIRGNGPNFCSGGDLAEFGTVPDVATAHRIRMACSAALRIHQIRDRVQAFVHGSCVGAGVELPAFAARVVADPGTEFSLPEVGMGLIPGAGGTASIPRRIGRERAGWLGLTGRKIDARLAARWGLVDEVS